MGHLGSYADFTFIQHKRCFESNAVEKSEIHIHIHVICQPWSVHTGKRVATSLSLSQYGPLSRQVTYTYFVRDFQLEYQPCVDVQQCWGLMSEFLLSFMDPSFSVPLPPKCSNKATELFCPSDTILQYMEVFNTYRKSAGTPLSQWLWIRF